MSDEKTVSQSILDSVKASLGIFDTDESYDNQIIIYTNAALSNLIQMGVGPESGYAITDSNNKWSEFESDELKIEQYKAYVCQKVKMMFDPPTNASVISSMERLISEMEYRITMQRDLKK